MSEKENKIDELNDGSSTLEVSPNENIPANSLDDKVIIYDKFDVYFKNPLVIIDKFNNVSIEEKLNSSFEMSMEIAYDEKSVYVEADNYIQVLDDMFKIRKVKRSRNSEGITLNVECEHIYFELLDDYIEEADRLTLYPHELAEYINKYTKFNIQVEDEIRNDRHKYPRRRATISRGSPVKTINRMLSLWNLDLDRFRRTVIVRANMNEDKVQLFKHQKNITSLEREDNGGQLTTRLHLIGNEGLSIEGIKLNEIEYPIKTEDGVTTIFSESGAVLGMVESSDGVITSRYIDSKYVDSYPTPRNGEIVQGEIYDKMELLLKGIEEINTLDSISNSFTLDVEELKRSHGEIERFGLGYTAILQDEDLLSDHKYNLIEARIIEYTYFPFENDKTSKIKLGAQDETVLDLFGSVEEVKQVIEENSESWNNAAEQIQQGLELYVDSNENVVEVSNRETEVASLEIDLTRDSVGQGQILVNLMSDRDSLFIIRVYDNTTQQLYSPIITPIKRGYNSIGIPHAYVKVLEGTHSFSVTAQTKDGTTYIQPRGVTYDIEVVGANIEHPEMSAEDISIRQTQGNANPTDIYLIGTKPEEEFPIVTTAPYVNGRLYKDSDFTTLWTLDSLLNVKNLMIEFNGVFELFTGDNIYSLVTQSKPWIFWIDEYDELWGQYGDEFNTRTLIAEGVINASAVKGWTIKDETQDDMGLIVAFVKYDGVIGYRRLVGLNDITKPNNIFWTTERQLTQAGSGNTAVQVNRLNDYRVAFFVEGINKIFISERTYVGQASPKEHVNLNTAIDDLMTIFTAMPANDIIEDLKPEWSTNDNKVFTLTAPYKWNIRGNTDGFNVVNNNSGVDIEYIYVDPYDQHKLIFVMESEITLGELVVRADPRYVLGKHENNTDIEIDVDILVFKITANVKENVNINPSIIADIDILRYTQLEAKESSVVNLTPGIESDIQIIQIEKIYLNEEGVVHLNLDINVELDVFKISEIDA